MYTYCNVNALFGRAVDAAHMVAIVSQDLNEQIEWAQKGIKTAEASESESWLGPLWNNLGVTYHEHKMHDSALSAFEKAREYHWRFSGEVAKLFADYHVGMTYRLLGKLDQAGQWLRPVLAWAERIENHSAIGQASEDLGEIEIALGNKSEGLKYLKRARDEYKAAGFDKSWDEIWSSINKRIAELESGQ
jgi:tetratricopeptide (TPR) repeat protein